MLLGQRLRSLRKSNNLRRDDVAEAIGVTPRLITFYETGDKTPSLEAAIKLADFFDVSLDYLVGRTDDPTPPKRGSSSQEPGS
ncbi:helix-turn-helix domain-containing protein [Alicyclobacillus sendaiensis]|uniref:Helix-turn-helix transcriptional regulator n=1 Tax=Alicyclobacillus sendaiensis PA2 TaxID=3029425 RepID=A0ABT6Y1Z1_ALISE|nr:helix-turn-helix transcriptional regulator [Alicyclobacillus sendaiensis]MDI9261277.1 helix-turn-helix transcriptional regulator [Alicyclobacillus sendaiensis PA2]